MTAVDLGLYASASKLADEVAGLIGVAPGDAYDALRAIPDNMLSLLDCPEGWSAIAGFVAADLGAPDPDYLPTVH